MITRVRDRCRRDEHARKRAQKLELVGKPRRVDIVLDRLPPGLTLIGRARVDVRKDAANDLDIARRATSLSEWPYVRVSHHPATCHNIVVIGEDGCVPAAAVDERRARVADLIGDRPLTARSVLASALLGAASLSSRSLSWWCGRVVVRDLPRRRAHVSVADGVQRRAHHRQRDLRARRPSARASPPRRRRRPAPDTLSRHGTGHGSSRSSRSKVGRRRPARTAQGRVSAAPRRDQRGRVDPARQPRSPRLPTSGPCSTASASSSAAPPPTFLPRP